MVVSFSLHFWPLSSCLLLVLTGLCDKLDLLHGTMLSLSASALLRGLCVVGVVAQFMKYLLQKQEDLSSIPNTPQKPGVTLALGGKHRMIPRGPG